MSTETRKLGLTQLAVTMPWSLFVRKGTRVLCSDGKIRTVAYLAQTPDTFFSTPAAIRIRGRYVTGYLTVEEASVKPYKVDRRAYAFRQHVGNEHLLPEWPQKFTQEHFDLLKDGEEIAHP